MVWISPSGTPPAPSPSGRLQPLLPPLVAHQEAKERRPQSCSAAPPAAAAKSSKKSKAKLHSHHDGDVNPTKSQKTHANYQHPASAGKTGNCYQNSMPKRVASPEPLIGSPVNDGRQTSSDASTSQANRYQTKLVYCF